MGTFGQADFASSGFRAGTPLAFDSKGNLYTQGNLYGPNGPIITRYAPDGTFLGTFGEANIGESQSVVSGLVFNTDGHLFVRTGGSIVELNAAGIFLRTFATLSDDGGLAFDGDGNLFATERLYGETGGIEDHKLKGALKKFDANGTLVATVTDPVFEGPANLLFLRSTLGTHEEPPRLP